MANRALLALASQAQEELMCAALASQGVAATPVPPSAHLETEIMRALHDSGPPPLIVLDLAVLAQLATSVSVFCAWKKTHCTTAPLVLYCSALHAVRDIERKWVQRMGALDLVCDCTGWLLRKPMSPALQQLLGAAGAADVDKIKLRRALDTLPAGLHSAITDQSPLAVFDQLAISPEELIESMCRRGGVQISKRLFRLKTYDECFVGSAAADWIARRFGLDRARATRVGQALLDLGHLYHVTRSRPFVDGNFFYRFSANSARLNQIDLETLLTRFRSAQGVPIRDRKYHAITYSKCFTGSKATSWLRNEYKLSHNEAMTLGQKLIDLCIVHHVVDEHAFKDGNYFYRFIDDESAGNP